ncbi:MAG: hypothetical protein U0822_07205 [Anaerolineae bacterium]
MARQSSVAKTDSLRVEDLRAKAVAHVVRRFPEMVGVAPTRSATSDGIEFTFRTTVEIGDKRLPRIVRVVMDRQGRVNRLITSR